MTDVTKLLFSSNEQVSEDENTVEKKGENKKLLDFDRFMRKMWFY